MASLEMNGLMTTYRPDTNLGPTYLAVSWTTLSLAAVLVAMRAFVRCKMHANGWDDYLIYLAWPICLCGSILDTLQVHYGFGRHAIYVRPTLIEAAKYGLLAEMLGVIATFLIKVSVCLFVLRLIRGTHPKIRMILWGLIVIQFGVAFVTDVLYGTACRPFKKLWDREQPGVCLSPEVLVAPMRLMGAFGAAHDCVCVIIPIFIIGGLQLNRRSKRAIIVVLFLGALTAACGIGRCVTANTEPEDPTYDRVPYVLWSLLEKNLGFLVACMPILRPLFATMLKVNTDRKLLSWNWYQKKSGGSTTEMLDQRSNTSTSMDGKRAPPVPPKSMISVRIMPH